MLHFLVVATPNRHALRFVRTREAHKTELAEDYVEVILDLIEELGEARVTDIAGRLGVTHPTVAKALRRLAAEDLVSLRPYRSLTLTEAGRKLAVASRARHKTVSTFLVALGLDEATADAEAEGIEHHVGKKTLDLMRRFARSSSP